jgi:hypothetical protein
MHEEQSMATTTTTVKQERVYGRKAFGHGKDRTDAQKAQDVAVSIAQREARGDTWTWSTYGLEVNEAQQQRVLAALATLERKERRYDTHSD